MGEKLKVKFLTVIWGARYIEEFAQVSLPSYLAPGNLPFVARETDLEIVIMTSEESQRKFDEAPIFNKLNALCPVRFIYIDDLITTGNYGVTLTLAYARGIRDSGTDQTNTHFIFMNSDFVLANGSLATLVGELKKGHTCIMAPSLRACTETTLPLLHEAVDQVTHTLTMAPREMVKLTFENLHPTVTAKTVTQEFITCTTHNQIYWQVDQNTLLARYHLIFMLAIKPEVPLPLINSYCDYGFVPETVPSGKFTILGDSDEFFMLEIQSEAQENYMLYCGTARPKQIANQLSQWTTREHRRFAEHDVVFHAGDVPAALTNARHQLAAYMSLLRQYMKKPLTHLHHFYWTSGVQAWALLKFGADTADIQYPPELSRDLSWRHSGERRHYDKDAATVPRVGFIRGRGIYELYKIFYKIRGIFYNIYLELLGRVRRRAGVLPSVPIWNYLWLDSQLLLSWISSIKRGSAGRNLLICEETSPLPHSLGKLIALDVEVEFDPADSKNIGNEPYYDNILIHVYRANVRRTREKFEAARKVLTPGGTVSIFIQHLNGEFDGSNFTWELAQYVNAVLAADWIGYRVTARFAGGLLKRRLRRAERRLLQYLIPTSSARVPLLLASVALWPIVAMLTVFNNLRLRSQSNFCPAYCSSALLSITRTAGAHGDTLSVVPGSEKLPPHRMPARAPAAVANH